MVLVYVTPSGELKINRTALEKWIREQPNVLSAPLLYLVSRLETGQFSEGTKESFE